MIITEADLVPLVTYEQVVGVPSLEPLDKMEPRVFRMHMRSGLLDDVGAALKDVKHAEHEMLRLLDQYEAGQSEAVVYLLAGSSIHFDRGFLNHHMPAFAARISHRHFDVSVLHQAFEFWNPERLIATDPYAPHRALDDLHHSLRVARYYRREGVEPK